MIERSLILQTGKTNQSIESQKAVMNLVNGYEFKR